MDTVNGLILQYPFVVAGMALLLIFVDILNTILREGGGCAFAMSLLTAVVLLAAFLYGVYVLVTHESRAWALVAAAIALIWPPIRRNLMG